MLCNFGKCTGLTCNFNAITQHNLFPFLCPSKTTFKALAPNKLLKLIYMKLFLASIMPIIQRKTIHGLLMQTESRADYPPIFCPYIPNSVALPKMIAITSNQKIDNLVLLRRFKFPPPTVSASINKFLV